VTTNDGTPMIATKLPWKRPISAVTITAMTIATIPFASKLPSGNVSFATTTPAMPDTYPIERSISPSSRTKTTPMAIVVTPAICTIRFVKLPAVRKFEFCE